MKKNKTSIFSIIENAETIFTKMLLWLVGEELE